MYTLETGDNGEPKGVLSVNGCSVVDCSVTELEEPCVKLSVEECEAEVDADSLGSGMVESPGDDIELDGETLDVSAELEGSESVNQVSEQAQEECVLKLTEIKGGESTKLLKEAMKVDESLKTARDLAEKQLNGY